MSFSDLASVGSFVSGFAVLVSLVFLYFQLKQIGAQVRQAEKNQQAFIRLGRTTRNMELIMQSAEPSLLEAIAKGRTGAKDISAAQLAQYMAFCRAIFVHFEDTYSHHKEALLSEEAFADFSRSSRIMLSQPGIRIVWKRTRQVFGDEFAHFIDKAISDVPVAQPIDQLFQWQEDVELARGTS